MAALGTQAVALRKFGTAGLDMASLKHQDPQSWWGYLTGSSKTDQRRMLEATYELRHVAVQQWLRTSWSHLNVYRMDADANL